jgi:hypothetical protein
MSQSISISDDYDLQKETFIVVLDSRNSDVDIFNPKYYASTDAFTLYSNSNLTFTFKQPIIDNNGVVSSSISVLNFTCPNSQNTINKTNNALVWLTDTNNTGYYTEQLIAFDYGNYTPTSFISALTGQLTAYFPTADYKVTFSSITNKIGINASKPFYFYSYPYNDFTSYDGRYTQGIGTIMGFNDIIAQGDTIQSVNKTIYTGIMTAFASSGRYYVTMPLPVNFSGINSINLYLANLVTQNVDSLTKTNNGIVCNIPVNCQPNDVIYYDKRSNFEFKLDQEFLNTLTIHLKDNVGNFIDLQGQPWNLTLEFNLLRKVPKQIKTFTQILSGGGM